MTRQAADRRVWLGLRDRFPHPYTVDHARQFIASASAASPATDFAIEVDGHVAGGIGYQVREDVERIGAEVGYWLGVEFWGRGAATTALRLLTAFVFDRHPALRRLYGLPFGWNVASARVLAKAGYRHEATLRQAVIKDGCVYDQLVFAILRDELSSDSAP
ncbi:MAG: GNAT family N-acetyltransferase [Acidobacteria bacterium]|nr:GNAT family N-acetyltransferase [Acidobacteriota bacterium]